MIKIELDKGTGRRYKGAHVTIRRRRASDRNSETYRYAGVTWMMHTKWYHLRLGWHVDTQGRLYVYLGRVNVWQDMWRPAFLRRKPVTVVNAWGRTTLRGFESKRFGLFEIVSG